jgi:dihydrofolate reductase / thymidylate synthase
LSWCHALCQFYVDDGYLSCILYQRSCDLGLGVPFNIASYALFTCMIAHVCDLKPKEMVHMMGDTHVYQTHVTALKQQLEREPYPFPKLELNHEIKNIEDFKVSDIVLKDYKSHPKIVMEMAV